ncbi:UNC-50 family protein [Schizosaccharomyces japonicus yFS275]|uniref:UNC-50 family protein n=1 Tax=Schizosaccharomyces japonicus (strain yFS275 / FY16936) TaxID=402676 RepID=B6K1I0_SCHJY|nr:UNC-50 family protein [Schizosaccharomyces japonicus yFS275]EEB07801.1 UNC-50 family protein [Schizosaccharomyces japonicus yFS275]
MYGSIRHKLRFLRLSQLDFEKAFWEMGNLVRAPRKVFRSIVLHVQTTNRYVRDDPAFIIVFGLLMALSGILWGLVYARSVREAFSLAFFMVTVDLLVVGALLASVGYLLARFVFFDREMSRSSLSDGTNGTIEWGYCLDVHFNAFFPVFVFIYTIQLFMAPFFLQDKWISLYFGNTLYLLAICYYFYLTFLGYQVLPFLKNTHYLLSPIPFFIVMWCVSLFGFNIPQHVISVYILNDQ